MVLVKLVVSLMVVVFLLLLLLMMMMLLIGLLVRGVGVGGGGVRWLAVGRSVFVFSP